jgi:ABC-type Zn uptake system ZnuABC Zn-binding protein ZnuA
MAADRSVGYWRPAEAWVSLLEMHWKPPVRALARSSCAVLVLLTAIVSVGACADDADEVPSPSPSTQPTKDVASPTQRPRTQLDLPVRVAVTLPIFEDFVRMAAGENADAFSLVPVDAAPETYNLTPADIADMEGVKFFYVNGLGLDDHIEDMIEVNRGELSYVVPFAPNVASPTLRGSTAQEAKDEAHLWLDPDLAAVYVAIIADEFVIYDEVNRAFYDESFRTAAADLNAFADAMDAEIATIPENRRKIVAFSDALTHLARRFGLTIVGTVESASDETGAAAQRLAQLVQNEGVPAVFAEYGHDASVLKQVASTAGVPICTLFTDVASDDVPDYASLMRANIDELLRCLAE